MKTFEFKIQGNPKNPAGNPMPKVKLTGNQQWTKRAQDYRDWKAHVVKAFTDKFGEKEFAGNYVRFGKPIVLGEDEHAEMKIDIWWNTETHADPESVFGSIADALFHNDKHLAGSFSYACSTRKKKHEGKIEAIINILKKS